MNRVTPTRAVHSPAARLAAGRILAPPRRSKEDVWVSIARLDDLLRFASAEGRISPRPLALVRLRELLGPGSPEPAILGGWVYSSDTGKRRSLERQLRYAADHGRLDEAERYLRALGDDEWYRDRYWDRRAWVRARRAIRRRVAPSVPRLPQLDLPL